MTPFKNYTPTQKMIEIVSVSVDKVLKETTELDDDQRIMDHLLMQYSRWKPGSPV